ncbi:hypothetical protein K1719_039527 [Acacia pycnantha]|nr:hypothetical protein K1719_039527 [Acacia pycnantha]
MGFPNFKIIDADGFKGGIWCLWSDKFSHVEVRESTNQFIYIHFTGVRGQVWEMTFVYGSPNIVLRRSLWRDLMSLSRSVHVPWCLGGDFNATLASDERCSWRSTRGSDREFCSFVDDAGLHDLGFVGPPFTWKRTGVESRNGSSLGYNFLARDLSDARRNILIGRLNGITRTESRFGLSMELEELQRSLWQQLEEVLTQESLIWAQKSRSEWVVDGDRNTRYFHARANGRRKRNYIGALKGSDEVWVYELDLIKEMMVSDLSTVFKEEQSRRSPLCYTVSFPDIDPADMNRQAQFG